jgi:Ca-activated chloride channel family protein
MTDKDDLNDLKAALRSGPPKPARKAAHLDAALQAFDNFHDQPQGSPSTARPNSDRSKGTGFWNGVGIMLTAMTSRAALATTSALVTAGLAVVLIVPMEGAFGPRDLALAPKVALTEQADTEIVMIDEPMIESPVIVEEMAMDDAMVTERSEADAAAPQMHVSTGVSVTGYVERGIIGGNGVETEFNQDIDIIFDGAPQPSISAKRSTNGAGSVGLLSSEAPGVRTLPPIAYRIIERRPASSVDTETFANAEENPITIVAETPVSTFSTDVDTASYSVVRQSLMSGHLPPRDAVRVEEMVNYFPYAYPAPDGSDAPFLPTVTVTGTPWNDGTQLVHIGLQGEMPELAERPPLNLVFLIDTSGSMQNANKLPLLKQSFRMMLNELRPEDQVAIVTYAGRAGQVLAPTAASERGTILTALDQLQAGGSTAGQAGLKQAYSVAEAMSEEGEVSRILLATDGDFNVGLSDPDALKTYIADKRDTGTYLSVLGFGRGNLDDATMQVLAQNGNGQAAYIDTLSEARKVLVDQLTGALFPIAGDVKVQVEFNPAQIAEYRLIGYETRALRREDFNNDKVDAGDIGAGHRVTALYEITPVGSDAVLNDPLRYQTETVESVSDEYGFLRLRWKEPGSDTSQLIETPITADMGTATTETRFATAMAGFGQLLRGSGYLGGWGYADAIDLANSGRGSDTFGYRAEAIQLMRLAESLSQ